MKILVTHINPHLDDITAVWLFKRFNPEFVDAVLEFISASRDAAKDEGEDKIYLGTGGGKYDEHKGDLEDCATSLVWKDFRSKGLLPQDELTAKALEQIVEWNRLIDLGKFPKLSYEEFTVPAFIRPRDSAPASSLKAIQLGFEILDRILGVLKKNLQAEKDFSKRIEFDSKFGKGVAVESEAVDRDFCRGQKGDLFIIINPRDRSVQYFTPSFDIDLEPVYKRLKQIDPQADWFLHQSHHIILCGASSAPRFTATKLSTKQLIDAAKAV
ncbi:MAG: hypothetical protein M1426_04630 [Patescibacteria group bacterium]|nr:hypothetical protein [Patescibacteria group bacterium]